MAVSRVLYKNIIEIIEGVFVELQQGVAQQMESLCIGESGEVIPSQIYAYSLPQAPQPTLPPQQVYFYPLRLNA